MFLILLVASIAHILIFFALYSKGEIFDYRQIEGKQNEILSEVFYFP